MSSFLLIFLLVIIACSLFFGFVILLADEGWKKEVNRRFFTFACFIAIWQIVNLLMLSSKDITFTLIWTRLSYTSGTVVTYFLLRLILCFPKRYINPLFSRIIDFVFAVLAATASIICLGPSVISSIVLNGGIITASYGQLYYIFPVSLIIMFLVFFILAIYNYIKSEAESKIQIKFVLIGIAIALVFVATTDVIAPFFTGNDFFSNFDVFGTFFIVSFTAYAIVKHQLFNIKVILTETAVGIVVIALFAQTLLDNTLSQRTPDVLMLILVSYGGYLLIKSVQDEIKKKEKLQELTTQLAQANAHLQDLDKMKTEFVSLASHELLTPVSAIEGYLSMMLDEHLAKIEDPKAIQYMDRVYRSAKRLARLIADMLNISRIEEGRLLVEKKDVEMTELIRQVLEELKFKADEHKQTMVFEDPKTQLMSFADPDKVKEVLVNLIGNSIKYSMNPGTITVSIEKAPTKTLTDTWDKIETEIKSRPLDDQESIHAVSDEHYRQILGNEQYFIRVKDQGIGIPQEELLKLFKKFHRVGDFSTAESQGTGLGLYITRALVELHHGRVWADSDGQGKGSTFTFTLPIFETKKEITDLEAQVPQTKEQLKPLAKPMGNDKEL